MQNTSPEKTFKKAYTMPYLMGYFLAANAVSDLCAVVDGLYCVMSKAYMIANHDLFSTLLSGDGEHRAVCTTFSPHSPHKNPDKRLAAALAGMAGSGRFGAIAVTGLPFCRLAGMDYQGLAASVSASVPVAGVPALSMEADWLDGYDGTLAALAGVLPLTGKKSRKKVAVCGYFPDRNEFDHAANLKEMKRLLGLAGLELVSVWPSGGDCAGLSRAGEAGLVVSLPYGRKAARVLARRTGAKLLETGLPMGLAGTSAWLAAVRKAAGLSGPLPEKVLLEEKAAAAAIYPALRELAGKNALFAGDPHLYCAFSSFAAELCVRVSAAFLDCDQRPLGAPRPSELLFAPSAGEAAAALARLPRHELPHLAVANSFAATEGLCGGAPLVELGFPSFGHHCLSDEPFFFYAGARVLAARLLNRLRGI
ncbi:MAG: nitrogenase component 1 [Elusimicrobiales bacterium]|nr:nitrogenase component 1 [Elusimicrobiales bacterium]